MLKLRRKQWPQELVDAVRATARQSGSGREDVLAAVQLSNGRWVAGTRAALYLPTSDAVSPGSASGTPPRVDEPTSGVVTAPVHPQIGEFRRVGWEQIERAGWDSEASVLHVLETTTFGTPLRATDLSVDDPGRFGQLLRERVDASVVVQRHVPLVGKKGVRIVGRRNPADTDAGVAWTFVLDKGIEPDRPGLIDGAEAALQSVRDEFGI